MGVDGGLYKFVLLLHIVTVVVGFGAVALNGIYGNAARRRGGAEGVAVSETNLEASLWAEKVIFAVPVLGILLVVLSDGAWGFDQAWISASFLLYLVGVGFAHAVVFPAHRRYNELLSGSTSPSREHVERLARTQAAGGAALNLMVVVLMALMIWKPGL